MSGSVHQLSALLSEARRGEVSFPHFVAQMVERVPEKRRDAALFQAVRTAFGDRIESSDLIWLEYTHFPQGARRPPRRTEVCVEEFDAATGRCRNWASVVESPSKVAVVLQAFFDDAARHYVSTLPDEESEEEAVLTALRASPASHNTAALLPFAIRLHRLWRTRNAVELGALLDSAASDAYMLMLPTERKRLLDLVMRCIKLERNPNSSLYENFLLSSHLRVLHTILAEGLGVESGAAWLLDAWMERAVTSLLQPDWRAPHNAIPRTLLSDRALPHNSTMVTTSGRCGSLRAHLQQQLRAQVIDIEGVCGGGCGGVGGNTFDVELEDLHARVVESGVVSEAEWSAWRLFDKDVLSEFVDAVLTAVVNGTAASSSSSSSVPVGDGRARSASTSSASSSVAAGSMRSVVAVRSPALAPLSPLCSPGAFESAPSLLLRSYLASSRMGPRIAMLLDAWVDYVLPLRLTAMARGAECIEWPVRASLSATAEEASAIAHGMLNERSGMLKLKYVEQLARAGQRHRISVHFVLLVTRDVARLGSHPVASLRSEMEADQTALYLSLMEGDFRSESLQRVVCSVLNCDGLHVGADGTLRVGDARSRERLHRLSVVLPPLDRRAWRVALQVWSGVEFGDPGTESAENDWYEHVVHPALSAWQEGLEGGDVGGGVGGAAGDERGSTVSKSRRASFADAAAQSSSSSSSSRHLERRESIRSMSAASAAAAAAAASADFGPPISDAEVEHATEQLDGPTRIVVSDLEARIADLQRALSFTVQRDEVSHAIRTNTAQETAEADLDAIRGEPFVFKYFEAFCYRMNETYAGCMGKLSGQVKANSSGHKVNFGALFDLLPDIFYVKTAVSAVLAPAIVALRMRSAGQACDFVRLASDPDEFSRLCRLVAVGILSDERKRRQLRYVLSREESQHATLRSIRNSLRRAANTRYDTTIARFAVHDAQVLVEAVMEGDLAHDTVESLRRRGDLKPLAGALTSLVIARTVTNSEQDGEHSDLSKLGALAQAAFGAARPHMAAAPRALTSIVTKIL